MKKLKLFLACCAVGAIAVYAISSHAQGCDAGTVYCLTMKPNQDGKYVRIAFEGKKKLTFAKLFCKKGGTLALSSSDIQASADLLNIGPNTKNTFIIDQCMDKSCSQAKNLKIATFNITGTAPNFVATPSQDSFSLDPSGESCTADNTHLNFQELK